MRLRKSPTLGTINEMNSMSTLKTFTKILARATVRTESVLDSSVTPLVLKASSNCVDYIVNTCTSKMNTIGANPHKLGQSG